MSCESKDVWGFVTFWCVVGLGVEHFVGMNVYLDLAMGVLLGAVLGGGLICIGKSSVRLT